MQIFDEKTANQVRAEERQYEDWQIKEKNRILRLSNSKRKQEQWSKLFPKLALDGLSEEDLARPW